MIPSLVAASASNVDRPTTARRGAAVVAAALLLALGLAGFGYWLQGDIGLNLADEGHLWYVTTRTALGEVPVRDIRAYDPGRYYWGAAWFKLLGPGILPLRLSLAACQAIGLFAALLVLRRAVTQWWILATLALTLLAWSFPLHKAFETTIVVTTLSLAALVAELPSPRRVFAAGVGVGLAGVVRIDHGVYGVTAFALLAALLALKRGLSSPGRMTGAWLGGLIVGYSPMALLAVLAPGFTRGFVEHLAYLVAIVAHSGNTNLPKPIPWPWVAPEYFMQMPFTEALWLFLFGCLLVALPLFLLGGAAHLLRLGPHRFHDAAVAAGAVAVGIPYLHYTFSRTDLEHLAPSIAPVVIGGAALVAASTRWRRTLTVGLLPIALVVSYLVVGRHSPYARLMAEPPGSYVVAEVAGERLRLHRSTAPLFAVVARLNERTLPPGEMILIAPHLPGLHVVLGRKAPLWETYFVYPETEGRQEEMIRRLASQHVDWALVADVVLDGREDLRFRNTHRLLWNHVVNEFDRAPAEGLPPHLQLFRRRPLGALGR